jgi:hypothetical protein
MRRGKSSSGVQEVLVMRRAGRSGWGVAGFIVWGEERVWEVEGRERRGFGERGVGEVVVVKGVE